MSKTTIIARTRADGTVVRVLEDGSEKPFPHTPMRPMTDTEVHAAAMADPDARPMTDAEWSAALKVPRTKTLRRALRLTQEAFAARYQIPLGTLRDWEQGKAEPDQSARAYLRAIAGDPVAVEHALQAAPSPR
jgi:putative transcriptional regulator